MSNVGHKLETTLLIKLLMVWFKEAMSLNIRVVGSLSLQIAILGLLPILSNLFSNTNLGYWLALILVVLLGAINQISYATATGIAGYFPPTYMSSMTTGTGLAGIATNIVRAFTILFFQSSTSEGQIFDIVMQYAITMIFLSFCILLHLKFIRSDYATAEIGKYPAIPVAVAYEI